ncbi:MAG: flagellar motor switch protein FliN, partial [Alphaproteobacteria bacterium]|nr:flagellar motor switch protein FliN [Alphaproteobacteria bacterium]
VVSCGIGTDARRAVDAIRAGAKEYLPLPPDPELIAAVLAAVADEGHQLIHEDEAMSAVLALADQVAGSEASILITGESGTGKEVMARYIHKKSARADKLFISVNCAAIPENLLESDAAPDNETKRSSADLEAVFDVPVTVSAVLGKSAMEVSSLLKLGKGTIVELDRKVGEAIDIYVNDRLVARGEVVLVEDRLGVTMTEIIKTGQS